MDHKIFACWVPETFSSCRREEYLRDHLCLALLSLRQTCPLQLCIILSDFVPAKALHMVFSSTLFETENIMDRL